MKKMNIWKEGKHIDLWSVNHFLSGVVFTGWMLRFGFEILIIFIMYLVVAIGWEIFETQKGIHEYFRNKIIDVVIGVLGFLLVYILIMAGKSLALVSLCVITLIYVGMETHGYVMYKKSLKAFSKKC